MFKGKEENYLSVYFKIIKLQNRKRTRVEVRCQTPLNPNKTIFHGGGTLFEALFAPHCHVRDSILASNEHDIDA